MGNRSLAELRLFQLISPSLPVGGFTYSQGLEWAIEAGWVNDTSSLKAWLQSVFTASIATLELPILMRLLNAFNNGDETSVLRWTRWLIACRETMELRKGGATARCGISQIAASTGNQNSRSPVRGSFQLPNHRHCPCR